MSHHFDTAVARRDPSLNVCDFYLFEGKPGATVMAMTVNPDVGLSARDILHPEGLYAFRFDLNGDLHEEVAFKFRFDPPQHPAADSLTHVQNLRVLRAAGDDIPGDRGDVLVEGKTGIICEQRGVRAFAGVTAELFAGDAVALHTFLNVFFEQHRFDPTAFLNRQDYFARRNIMTLVLEVPNDLIGQGRVQGWATTSVFGHAPETQIQRWGLPLLTNLFLSSNSELKEQFNASRPSADQKLIAEPIAGFVERMSSYANSVVNPAEYGKQIAARLCPAVLPYELGTIAKFDREGFNGRHPGEDVMDVMLSLAANLALADGVSPDRSRVSSDFPYFGKPYTILEQRGVTPANATVRK